MTQDTLDIFNISDPMVFWTMIMGLASLLNLIVAFIMWCSIAQSVKLSRFEIEQSYRPLITLLDIRSGVDIHHLNNIDVVSHFQNFGKIPAQRFVATWQAHQDGLPISKPIPIPMGTSDLFPGAKAEFQCTVKTTYNFPLDPFNADKINIYLFLNARYTGLGDKEYSTYEGHKFEIMEGRFVLVDSKCT